MKVYVDQDLCISCGACIATAPEVFDWNADNKAEAISGDVPDNLAASTKEAMQGCPTEAIKEK